MEESIKLKQAGEQLKEQLKLLSKKLREEQQTINEERLKAARLSDRIR